MKKQGRGGPRSNAGRKTEGYLEVSKRTVTLDDMTIRKAKVLGNGNLSQGLRRGISAAFDLYLKTA